MFPKTPTKSLWTSLFQCEYLHDCSLKSLRINSNLIIYPFVNSRSSLRLVHPHKYLMLQTRLCSIRYCTCVWIRMSISSLHLQSSLQWRSSFFLLPLTERDFMFFDGQWCLKNWAWRFYYGLWYSAYTWVQSILLGMKGLEHFGLYKT